MSNSANTEHKNIILEDFIAFGLAVRKFKEEMEWEQWPETAIDSDKPKRVGAVLSGFKQQINGKIHDQAGSTVGNFKGQAHPPALIGPDTIFDISDYHLKDNENFTPISPKGKEEQKGGVDKNGQCNDFTKNDDTGQAHRYRFSKCHFNNKEPYAINSIATWLFMKDTSDGSTPIPIPMKIHFPLDYSSKVKGFDYTSSNNRKVGKYFYKQPGEITTIGVAGRNNDDPGVTLNNLKLVAIEKAEDECIEDICLDNFHSGELAPDYAFDDFANSNAEGFSSELTISINDELGGLDVTGVTKTLSASHTNRFTLDVGTLTSRSTANIAKFQFGLGLKGQMGYKMSAGAGENVTEQSSAFSAEFNTALEATMQQKKTVQFDSRTKQEVTDDVIDNVRIEISAPNDVSSTESEVETSLGDIAIDDDAEFITFKMMAEQGILKTKFAKSFKLQEITEDQTGDLILMGKKVDNDKSKKWHGGSEIKNGIANTTYKAAIHEIANFALKHRYLDFIHGASEPTYTKSDGSVVEWDKEFDSWNDYIADNQGADDFQDYVNPYLEVPDVDAFEDDTDAETPYITVHAGGTADTEQVFAFVTNVYVSTSTGEKLDTSTASDQSTGRSALKRKKPENFLNSLIKSVGSQTPMIPRTSIRQPLLIDLHTKQENKKTRFKDHPNPNRIFPGWHVTDENFGKSKRPLLIIGTDESDFFDFGSAKNSVDIYLQGSRNIAITGPQHDQIDLGNSNQSTIETQGGDDIIYSPINAPSWGNLIKAGEGDDKIFCGSSTNIFTGSGRDRILIPINKDFNSVSTVYEFEPGFDSIGEFREGKKGSFNESTFKGGKLSRKARLIPTNKLQTFTLTKRNGRQLLDIQINPLSDKEMIALSLLEKTPDLHPLSIQFGKNGALEYQPIDNKRSINIPWQSFLRHGFDKGEYFDLDQKNDARQFKKKAIKFVKKYFDQNLANVNSNFSQNIKIGDIQALQDLGGVAGFIEDLFI